jgi:hypothetical protein
MYTNNVVRKDEENVQRVCKWLEGSQLIYLISNFLGNFLKAEEDM